MTFYLVSTRTLGGSHHIRTKRTMHPSPSTSMSCSLSPSSFLPFLSVLPFLPFLPHEIVSIYSLFRNEIRKILTDNAALFAATGDKGMSIDLNFFSLLYSHPSCCSIVLSKQPQEQRSKQKQRSTWAHREEPRQRSPNLM